MTLPMADCHNDLLLAVQFQRDRGHDDPFGDFWLPQLRAGGVVLQVLPIWTDDHFVGEGALRRALRTIEIQTPPAGEQPPAGTFIPGLLRPADLPGLGDLLVDRLGCDAAARVCSDTLVSALGRLLPA